MSVLILEDEEAILDGLVAALAREYTVIATQTAEEAIRQFANYRHYIDLLVAPANLPSHGSGVELARRFREEVSGLPIILMSALKPSLWGERDITHLNWLGPHSIDFLQTPFSMADLMASAQRMIPSNRATPLRAAGQLGGN